jgi:UDPglucose 6-dehydrogenase
MGAASRLGSYPIKGVMKQPIIVDLRNIYRTDEMRRAAFRYVPIGRAEVK